MLTLTLLRHAKSDWSTDGQEDFDRPLAPRGLKAAPMMGQALQNIGPRVEKVLCSPAKRTRETLALVLPQLSGDQPDVTFIDRLYHALPDHLFEHVIDHADTAKHVLLVGHNPGLEILAAHLARHGRDEDITALNTKFPTAALAQLQFPSDIWPNIDTSTGELTHFLTPRRLTPTGRA